MPNELEQEFYDTFGIEPEYTYIGHYPLTDKNGIIQPPAYPDITAEKLLEMICIYNEFQNCADYMVTPTNINTLKDNFLKIIIKSVNDKYMNTYFCNDDKKLKTKIQQIFSEK